MLATLRVDGVMPSLSRAGVSNDNPYFESLFKEPEVPGRSTRSSLVNLDDDALDQRAAFL
ncbi:hypothetical protein BJG93_36100 [Paraburkholderia sprentiae WSM5005]|uniref:Uncharacterized protein n=1 Tax=Paraburkholderia sprentiae WSM5005 TaxID=754502 RepID=A0A8F4QKQ6_9BURK|nr:hypothetical protein [Paraburkholderia sprentiae]QXE07248.1 hypothetical protein BJG93_36100 [Paraburkholderia sprentiae WSM5005]